MLFYAHSPTEPVRAHARSNRVKYGIISKRARACTKLKKDQNSTEMRETPAGRTLITQAAMRAGITDAVELVAGRGEAGAAPAARVAGTGIDICQEKRGQSNHTFVNMSLTLQ